VGCPPPPHPSPEGEGLGDFCSLSKAWYLAQILPMPPAVANRLRRAVSDFLWKGRLERLAFDELHSPIAEGGLHLSAITTRAQALLAKQACHRLAGGGNPAGHIAYWVGLRLRGRLPALGGGPHAEDIPPAFKELASLLLEVFSLPEVSVTSLADVTSKYVYGQFTSSLPPPKMESRQPDLPWRIAWARLAGPALSAAAADVMFSLLHNILPLQVRRHRLQLAPSPHCPHCPGVVEDAVHFFTACSRASAAWSFLALRVALLIGGPVADRLLLFFAWPPCPADGAVALAVATYVELAWSSRDEPGPILPVLVRARVDVAAAEAALPSIFRN
jgi:hypothetical protein